MEVILREDVANLGKMGEVVRVRDGYARNYLLPRKLVLIANKKNLKSFEHQKRVVADQRGRVVKQAETLAEKLAALSLVFPVKAGEEGKLFGSVTNIDIEKALKAKGFEVERRKIHLAEPIKALGDYEVAVRLTADVTANVKLSVVAELEKKVSV
ncbi:MAG: 50S ribosomal protein L9 [Deltaproteobacteria bacterium RIFCSPLOWO2_12_FULL_60_19]|nr:MAG: 50S ribosomal protein L9 [Deltaproteobacteria bacterium RIFCSPLOWO2_12_FULL_60_19]